MASGDEMGRAIQALRTGAVLPAETAHLLADYLEAHLAAELDTAVPKGWLSVDMAGVDFARCLFEDRRSGPDELKRTVTALRDGTSVPGEASPALATLLEKHQMLEWPDNPAESWRNVDAAAQNVARSIIDSIG